MAYLIRQYDNYLIILSSGNVNEYSSYSDYIDPLKLVTKSYGSTTLADGTRKPLYFWIRFGGFGLNLNPGKGFSGKSNIHLSLDIISIVLICIIMELILNYILYLYHNASHVKHYAYSTYIYHLMSLLRNMPNSEL